MSEKYINYFDGNFKLDFFPPTNALNSFIEDYIYFAFPSEKLNNSFMHPFPNGNYELYLCLGKSKVLIKKNKTEFCFKNFLIAISELSDQTLFKTVTEDDFYKCVVVELKINALNHFFNTSMGKYKNDVVDTDILWGKKAKHLSEVLNSNHNINSIINYLNLFFESFIGKVKDKKRENFCNIIDYCILKEGQLSVDELAYTFRISYRTLLRTFLKEIGLTPKEYLRILRFNKVCLLMNKYPEMDWSELYYTCGYYDQSHFIHDFKDIIKSTPNQFFKLTGGKFYLKRPYFITD